MAFFYPAVVFSVPFSAIVTYAYIHVPYEELSARVFGLDPCRCGNNYGWSVLEGNRCQNNVENKDPCDTIDRSIYEPPYFEYCHQDYQGQDTAFTAGIDICGDRSIVGSAVIGAWILTPTYYIACLLFVRLVVEVLS